VAAQSSSHAARPAILLTRPEAESRALAQALHDLDAECIVFPSLEIRPVEPDAAASARIEALDRYDLAIFVSANAVRCGLALVRALRTWPAHTGVAAIGAATAQALEEAGFAGVLAPESGHDSDALLAHPSLQRIEGERILVVRGVGGREQLAQALRARGARIDYLEAYQRAAPDADPAPVRDIVDQGRVRATVAASAEGVRNLLGMLGPHSAPALRRIPLFVHHPRIAEAASALGFSDVRLAPAQAQALLPALRECLSSP